VKELALAMATVTLKVKSGTPPGADAPPPSASAGPLFRGTGDTDYLCGQCGFAIVSGFAAGQHVSVDVTVCPACGAENEFPPELRS
jgi:hypothetical protein